MEFCQISKLPLERYRSKYEPASKLDRSKLWKLAEELSIPTKELNKLAKEVIGREFGVVSKLTITENRKFRKWLEGNRIVLGERYRKILWTNRS